MFGFYKQTNWGTNVNKDPLKVRNNYWITISRNMYYYYSEECCKILNKLSMQKYNNQ